MGEGEWEAWLPDWEPSHGDEKHSTGTRVHGIAIASYGDGWEPHGA